MKKRKILYNCYSTDVVAAEGLNVHVLTKHKVRSANKVQGARAIKSREIRSLRCFIAPPALRRSPRESTQYHEGLSKYRELTRARDCSALEASVLDHAQIGASLSLSLSLFFRFPTLAEENHRAGNTFPERRVKNAEYSGARAESVRRKKVGNYWHGLELTGC